MMLIALFIASFQESMILRCAADGVVKYIKSVAQTVISDQLALVLCWSGHKERVGMKESLVAKVVIGIINSYNHYSHSILSSITIHYKSAACSNRENKTKFQTSS